MSAAEVPGPAPTPDGGGVSGLVAALREAAGGELVAVVHFGSQLVGASPGARSAHDLFVVVDGYREFYARTARTLPAPVSAPTLARLNRFLPPNVVFLPGAGGPGAKLFVIRERDLAHSVARGPDHFCRGRLMQLVNVVYARDEAVRTRLDGLLARNRRETLRWIRPYLPGPFTVETYCRRMLEVSYGEEIRPESAARRDEVFGAQREFWREAYGPVLAGAAEAGALSRSGDEYRYADPAGAPARFASRLYFLRSKTRATLRWAKYVLTFDAWLDYIAAKSERRTGVPVNLTEREKRYPLLFAWPKLIRVLRARRKSLRTEAK